MIQITPHMRILVAVKPVDFRKGIDGLSRLCRVELQADPFAGHLFIFCNRGKTAIKILTYDGQGFWVCHKRLSRGRFQWWPGKKHAGLSVLQAHELQSLIWNGNPWASAAAPMWKSIAA
jgi:transposase